MLSFVLVKGMMFASPLTVSAAGTTPRIPNPSQYNSLEDIVNVLAGLIRPVFIITFAAMMLYGAGIWLTARDDDSKIGSAKKVFGSAVIGFGLAVLAPAITNIIAGFLGVENLSIITS